MAQRTVLVDRSLPFAPPQWDRLNAALQPDATVVVDLADATAVSEALAEAEIALLSNDLDARFVGAPKLKWIHCDHAGLTRSARPEVFENGLIVTGSAGRSGAALAEHAMMFALLLCSRYPDFYEAQKRHEWRRAPEMADLRALSGRTMGIIGMGHTGTELAARASAFNMTVLGYRRRIAAPPPGVERIYSADAGEGIGPILDAADILVLAINLSDATRGLIGAAELARLKPSAVLVNMSRGKVIDQDALVTALREGRLAGAGLDVTDPEPLPADHPLWETPNVLITPHYTPALPDKSDRSLGMILENLMRYRAGQPMINRITPEDVWSGDGG